MMTRMKRIVARGTCFCFKNIGNLMQAQAECENWNITGQILAHPRFLFAYEEMMVGMSILPAFPGTKTYYNNLKYTTPFVDTVKELVDELC